MIRARLAAAALLLAACGEEAAAPPGESARSDPHAAARPISWSDLLDRPRETADARIAYGQDGQQFGELWLPAGDGPHPVVMMVHGGCWLAEIPGTILMDYVAAALRDEGVAVWNIEYRRLGHDGGGYPGTFEDVAAAADHLRRLAEPYALDLDRLVFTGHSAGGHLALWAAARPSLPPDSPLAGGDPLVPDAVVTLAGINDLAAYRALGPGRCGEPETVDRLVGGGYADTSPAALLPVAVPQSVISGAADPIVPPALGEAYADQAEAAGDSARHVILDEAGHFELIDPLAPAWPPIRDALLDPLGAEPR